MQCTARNYTKSEYDSDLRQGDVGVNLEVIDGQRIEIFTEKGRIQPVGADLLSGRNIVYVPISSLTYSLSKLALK